MWTRLQTPEEVAERVKRVLESGGISIKIESSHCQEGWYDIFWYYPNTGGYKWDK